MGSDSGRRYDSLRRQEQAKQTRAEIADAARRLFVSQGWAATTVRDVAREAGVAVPTVYAAYQNKTNLVWALADAADLSADLALMLDELEGSADPERQLLAMAAYDRRLFERSGDLIALIREAGRTEPDLATFYEAARRKADGTRARVFSSWPDGTLAEGLDLPTAVDIYAALCSVDVYTTLTQERGWGPERVERWWTRTLARELLAP
ncbi:MULTISPECIES: helix-turn-helix domain-containing protein [unclassified Streptomyces]|uniref:TetR/AcrR family transcriptional regulator n=1 Tax=unclassified Streptomyces TaxID=2593676 RepID=UPI002DD7B03C|nr:MULTISPECIES: helix-turn-helix domain-containing protein [unclassified Streptomyces]WSA96799.1 TetR/AcrR family transcriptional regulator [Streptomyces sp. NBC_01795]WSB81214.1 TetR/AcrR family transcriptional regulator [Streptomyces sp. NBC_01775]WSS10578.1 TetR/AcrR family transcriptional regulator [Streptomyces sp. NBC_01186]WSS39271.1 TetR/AcrR family transcriptional regulator [Streptomyces sp. NBC_01187]